MVSEVHCADRDDIRILMKTNYSDFEHMVTIVTNAVSIKMNSNLYEGQTEDLIKNLDSRHLKKDSGMLQFNARRRYPSMRPTMGRSILGEQMF